MLQSNKVRIVLLGTGLALVLLGLSPVSASSANISHSFTSAANVKNGSLVSLDPARTNYVEPASSSNGKQLLGVVVAANDSLLAVDANSGNIQVATSGTVSALVTTINGVIKVGDQVGVSPFNGVGMKAAPGTHVIGLAQTGFNASSEGVQSETVTDKAGHSQQVALGYLRLNIGIGTATTAPSSEQLSTLQRLGKSLTGHTVSTLRIFISLVITIIALIAIVTLIYASVYGGIISIGRNPLAKYAVFRNMALVMGMVMLVAVVAGLFIFLLLR